jgi:hypothetical protein
MEGTKCTRSQPLTLAVLQEFVGGRLERQWLSRAYELAAPMVCVVAGKIRFADPTESSSRLEVTMPPVAKGA